MPSVNARFVYRIVSVGLAFLILLQMFKLRQSLGAAWFDDREHASESLCEDLRSRGLDDVLVVLKTGANEAREKLPAHFDATLRCVPHYVVYSDMEETIEGHQVHNVLDEVNPTILEQYPDFEYYRQLQEHGMEGFSAAQLAEWASVGNTRSGKDSPGWRLDKWKFLPMADKALRHRPQAKWYIFVEADTFVIWRNIAKWLAHFDASKPYYMGLQMRIGEIVFGYGGAGVVLSNPALTKLVEHRNASLTFYDEFTAGHWAGDCIMGKALQDAGVDLFWSWPTIISENPLAMDFEDAFGGNARKLWCHYAVTYHHLSTREVLQLADFEEEWNAEVSLLHPFSISPLLLLPNAHADKAKAKAKLTTVRAKFRLLRCCDTKTYSGPSYSRKFDLGTTTGTTCPTPSRAPAAAPSRSAARPAITIRSASSSRSRAGPAGPRLRSS